MQPNAHRDRSTAGGGPRGDEAGFALLLVLTTLVPCLLLVGMFGSVLNARGDELAQVRGRERALHAAESGVDFTIFRGRRGLLHDGDTYVQQLDTDTTFQVVATHLLFDGEDNDLDGTDDDPDEDVFQVVVTGRYLGHVRRLAAYLGPVPLLPNVRTALAVANPAIDLRLQGTPRISGFDAAGALDVPALSIFQPGTVAQLGSTLTGAEPNAVVGPGGPPSLGDMAPIDLADVVAVVQNIADVVLASNRYSGLSFGDPSGSPQITYREGNVRIGGNSRGAGILVVTGDLEVLGTFEFDGLIVVLGNLVNSAGTATIRGAVLQGPTASYVDLRGTFDLQYSTTALDLAQSNTGLYVAFNGWQELQR